MTKTFEVIVAIEVDYTPSNCVTGNTWNPDEGEDMQINEVNTKFKDGEYVFSEIIQDNFEGLLSAGKLEYLIGSIL